MKIRTDFITNSSSSSYCTVKLELMNGKCVSFKGAEEYNQFLDTDEVEDKFKAIKSDEDLYDVLTWCAGIWKRNVQGVINDIGNWENVKSIAVVYRYECSDGDDNYNGMIRYNRERNTVTQTSSQNSL